MKRSMTRRQFLGLVATTAALTPVIHACAPVTLAPEGAAPGAPAREAVTIELWAPHPLDDNIKITDFMAEYFKPDHPDIDFKFTRVPSEWEQKFRTAAAGRQLPDMFAVDGINVPAYASRGLCAEIDDSVIGADVLDDFYPPARAEMQYQGKTYAVVLETNSQAVRLNLDLMNQAGVTAPATWDELIEVGQQLTFDQNGVHANEPGYDPNAGAQWAMETWCCRGEGSTWMITPFIWMNGGEVIDEATRAVKIAEPPAIEAIQFLKDLVQKYYIWPRAGAVPAGPEGTWYGQLVVMSWTGAFDLANLTVTRPPSFNWDIAPIPYPAGGRRISGVGGWLISAWKEGRNVPATMPILQFMTTPTWQRHVSTYGYALTGRRSIAEERLAEVPQLKIFLEAMEGGKARPRSDQYPLITEALQQAFDETIFGDRAVEEALVDAEAKIKDAIAQEAS